MKVKTHLLGKKTIVVRGKAYEVDRFLFWKYWIWDNLAYAGQRVWEFLKLFADFLETLGDVLLWMISGRWMNLGKSLQFGVTYWRFFCIIIL